VIMCSEMDKVMMPLFTLMVFVRSWVCGRLLSNPHPPQQAASSLRGIFNVLYMLDIYSQLVPLSD
jgi:hypothetical protein